MDSDSINTLRAEQLDSYGRLLAGFSHEMKNHMGVIRESSGLLQDLVAMHGAHLDEQVRTRLEKATAMIEERVKTTAQMLHHLSGFAHRSDVACSAFQPGQVVEELCMFLQRFARLSKCELAWRTEPGAISIHNDPSLLHHLLYRLFALVQERFEPGDSLLIETGADDGQAMICFYYRGAPATQLNLPEELNLPLALLQGSCVIEKRDGGHEIRVRIPSLPLA
ncbi:hypothetical protein JWJ90_11230 [Desulfobulbus rhabdoformis]|uniref:hypothetical protein n=1 Tax=Desulfobulbus rhabdoformis TaxID=34032 RepID=UPI00196440E1|nr:hypothetical protein [Desulfobulbus rhabdoformis]MBM9614856.1 hypothetical protein [Desulfobulbus rhabdoformis]